MHIDTHLFSSDYMFQTPSGTPSVYFGILTAGFVVLFLVCAFAYWRRGKIAPNNAPLRREIRRMAKCGMWSAGIGIFLNITRYAQIPYFSMPILLYLLLLGMIVVVGYFIYEFSARYPMAVWRLQESQAARRFRPAARPRGEPQRARPKVRGKQRRR